MCFIAEFATCLASSKESPLVTASEVELEASGPQLIFVVSFDKTAEAEEEMDTYNNQVEPHSYNGEQEQ